jgi:hypothetical protein
MTTIETMFAVAEKLPCEYCSTNTALVEAGRVIGIRHYEDCPMFDACCRFSTEYGAMK